MEFFIDWILRFTLLREESTTGKTMQDCLHYEESRTRDGGLDIQINPCPFYKGMRQILAH
ncbi:hypothetical protein D7W81_09825 [Corallococcus aberystwythensis]|uniref:Uncharacterized protein n=1 Tax=Corallococcus aberystwythensis TaxID=2316722 RepID=A0A3A8R419_9BACT|nr:hypothetical protein D7W81_09825 [Corallococcus aberystwythensis]